MTVVLIADHDGLARRMMHGALTSSGAVAAVIGASDGRRQLSWPAIADPPPFWSTSLCPRPAA